jgi:hypothetical protein
VVASRVEKRPKVVKKVKKVLNQIIPVLAQGVERADAEIYLANKKRVFSENKLIIRDLQYTLLLFDTTDQPSIYTDRYRK